MTDALVWTLAPGGVHLHVRVTPRASRNAFQDVINLPDGPALKVSVTAPPENGRANAAVLKLLAKALHQPKTALAVTAGTTARSKTIFVPGDAATLEPMLEALIKNDR